VRASYEGKKSRIESASFWENFGKKRALGLFKMAAARIPAYRYFLKQNRINPQKIKSWNDFQQVPPVSKKNYLRQHPLRDLCWDGTLARPLTFTATSGSTGLPFYFPRQLQLDEQYSTIIETYLASNQAKNKNTLVIVCFGMGVWIGGLITYKAFEIAANRLNAHVSIITPGINKAEIFNALKILAPQYDEVIIIGYPPFIKDIIDESPAQGIDLRQMRIRFLFAAEGFTETFRDYLAKCAGVKNLYRDMLNIYGSADIGAMAYETGISILIKRLAIAHQSLFSKLFNNTFKNPTLAQFNPAHIYFEAVNGEILLTGDNAVPLIRYAIGDNGGVWEFDKLQGEMANDYQIDILNEAKKRGILSVQKFPFVYIYERKDFSTKLYGAIIYPEHIREVLQYKRYERKLTGKFVMSTLFDKSHDSYLEINIELKNGVSTTPVFQDALSKDIVNNLIEKNAEFHNNYKVIPKKVTPKLVFNTYNDQEFFKPGIKQRWVKTAVK
jgi:phenylacetate-CoA ligase